MKEYRLVINLNDTSITTKQVGEDSLFKIRKVDGFRAYPCESKSDVQEYFEKLKTDCFNVTNFTKETFNVILLSECSNQEIVDAVKAEIQDTTFTVLDSTFSKAFNSDDNNSEELDDLSQKNSTLSSEKDTLSTKIEKLETEKDNLSKEITELQKSNKLTLDKASKLESTLSNYNIISSKFGFLTYFGKGTKNKPLRWFVCNVEDNCLSLILEKGILCSNITTSSDKLEQKVTSYLNNNFLVNFSDDEIALMKTCSKASKDVVELLGENEFSNLLLPKLKLSPNKDYLLKNMKIYEAKSSSIIQFKKDVDFLRDFYPDKPNNLSPFLFRLTMAAERPLENRYKKLNIHPVIKVRLK